MPDVLLIVTDDQRVPTVEWMDDGAAAHRRTGKPVHQRHDPDVGVLPLEGVAAPGLFAHSTGVWSNGRSDDIPDTGGWSVFNARGMEDRTIAVWLRQAGYRTVAGRQVPQRLRRLPRRIRATRLDRDGTRSPSRNGAYFDYALRHTDGSGVDAR